MDIVRSNINKVKILLILIIALIFSCNNAGSNLFGYSYNPVRKKLGVPELPKRWILNKDIMDTEIWFWHNPHEPNSPFFERKTVHVVNGKLMSDFNIFYGSKKYFVDEIYERERLRLGYYSTKSELDSLVCTFSFDSETHYEPKIITKQQADSLLKIWHLDTPNSQ